MLYCFDLGKCIRTRWCIHRNEDRAWAWNWPTNYMWYKLHSTLSEFKSQNNVELSLSSIYFHYCIPVTYFCTVFCLCYFFFIFFSKQITVSSSNTWFSANVLFGLPKKLCYEIHAQIVLWKYKYARIRTCTS